MRFWIRGPRIGMFRPGVSFSGNQRYDQRGRIYPPRPTGEFVYVIESGDNTVKIGYSSNPEARLATLQTGSGFPLSLVHVANASNAAAVERRAHEILARHRLSGEWFDCRADVAIGAIHAAGHQLGVLLSEGEVGSSQVAKRQWLPVILFCALAIFAAWIVWHVANNPTPVEHGDTAKP